MRCCLLTSGSISCIIGIALFFGIFFGSYLKVVQNNELYDTTVCRVIDHWTTNAPCYQISSSSCPYSSCSGTSCADRIRQKTNGICCSDPCCAYKSPVSGGCTINSIAEQVVAWGICYNIYAKFQVLTVNMTISEIVNDCGMDDSTCVQTSLQTYSIGSTRTCWITKDQPYRVTSIDPIKPTTGPIVGFTFGLVFLLAGLICLIGFIITYRRHTSQYSAF